MRTFEKSLGRLIYHTAQDMNKMAEKILYPYNITVEQMHLLKNISLDAGLSQKTLGGVVGKTPANLTRILDRLEAKALILRRPDLGDRRAYLVFLTDKGMALVKNVDEMFQSISDRIVCGISIEMQRQVRDCLEIIGENIQKMAVEFKKDSL